MRSDEYDLAIVRRDLVKEQLVPMVVPKGKRKFVPLDSLVPFAEVHKFYYRYLPRETKAGNNIELSIVQNNRLIQFQGNSIDFDFL